MQVDCGNPSDAPPCMQSARDGAGALDPGLGPRGPRPESHSACREQPVESKTQGSSADTSIISAHTLLHVDRDFPGALRPIAGSSTTPLEDHLEQSWRELLTNYWKAQVLRPPRPQIF